MTKLGAVDWRATLRARATRSSLARLAWVLAAFACLLGIPVVAVPRGLAARGGGHCLGDPFLALVDVFTGGAFAAGALFALGPYPYGLGRFAAKLFLPASAGASELATLEQRAVAFGAAAAAGLSIAYPPLVAHLAGAAIGPFRPSAALALATGALALVWLARQLGDRLGGDDAARHEACRLLVAAGVLAALPSYLLAGAPSKTARVARAMAALLAAVLYLWMSSLERRIGTQLPPLRPGRPQTRSHLPLPLNPSRLAPLFGVVAGFGAVHALAGWLERSSSSGAVRLLAAAEGRWTGLASPLSWLLFGLLGSLAKALYARAALDLPALANDLRKTGTFVPGFRPGKPTEAYLRRVFARVGWIEPCVSSGMVAVLGIVASATDLLGPRASSWWPVLLLPLFYVTQPVADLWRRLGALALATGRYDGLTAGFRSSG